MKKILLAAFAGTFLFAACGTTEQAGTETTEDHATHDHASHDDAAHDHSSHAMAAVLDPVCNMEKADNWTEFSVVNNDTTWFCSPRCKEQFDKDPAKYPKH